MNDEQKRGPGRPKKDSAAQEPQTVSCRIVRDFWTADGERVRKNGIVDLDPMTAIAKIEQGAVERLK